MAQQFKSIDEYIETFPKDIQERLETLRKFISVEVPEAKETISYNMPTFTINGDYFIYFAGWKKHIALYPFTGEMIKTFKEASEYDTSGKGTIKFPHDQPLPLPFIKKIIKFRLDEVSKK